MEKVFFSIMFFILASLLLFSSCTPWSSSPSNPSLKAESLPRIEILSWSPVTSTLILLSSQALKLEEYALRQGDTKQIEILKKVSLRANEATTIHISKGFLNKKENEIVLVKLLEVDRKKDF